MLEKLVAEDYKLLMRELDEKLKANLFDFLGDNHMQTLKKWQMVALLDEICHGFFGMSFGEMPPERRPELENHIRQSNLVEKYPISSDSVSLIPAYVDMITGINADEPNPTFERIVGTIYSSIGVNRRHNTENMPRKPDELFKYTLGMAFAVHGLTKRKNRQLYIDHIMGALENAIGVHASDDSLSIINIHDVGEEIYSRKCRLRMEKTHHFIDEMPDLFSIETIEGDVETALLDENIDRLGFMLKRLASKRYNPIDGERIKILNSRLRQISKVDPQHYSRYSFGITDLGASLAKLADNVDNTASIGTFDLQKRLRLAFKTILIFESRKNLLKLEEEVDPMFNGNVNSNDEVVLKTQNRRLWGWLNKPYNTAENEGYVMRKDDFMMPVNGHGLAYDIYSHLQRLFFELYDPNSQQMDDALRAAEIYQSTLNFRFVHYKGDIDMGLRRYVEREFPDLAADIMKFDDTILKYYFATEAQKFREKGELGFIENDDRLGLLRDTVMMMAIIQRYYSHPDIQERFEGFDVGNLENIRNLYMSRR
jgi:hypothetical protein